MVLVSSSTPCESPFFLLDSTCTTACADCKISINPALFVYDSYAEPFGGYNLLCNPPPNPFNGTGIVVARQDRGYRLDGLPPTPAAIASRQDRSYKPDGSAPPAFVVADGQDSHRVKGDELTLLLPHPTRPDEFTPSFAAAANGKDGRMVNSDGVTVLLPRLTPTHVVRQDRGYKPDGSSPDHTIEKRQDRGYKPGSSTHSLIGAADNCSETHVVPTQTWVNYAPSADFITKHGRYVVSGTPGVPCRASALTCGM